MIRVRISVVVINPSNILDVGSRVGTSCVWVKNIAIVGKGGKHELFGSGGGRRSWERNKTVRIKKILFFGIIVVEVEFGFDRGSRREIVDIVKYFRFYFVGGEDGRRGRGEGVSRVGEGFFTFKRGCAVDRLGEVTGGAFFWVVFQYIRIHSCDQTRLGSQKSSYCRFQCDFHTLFVYVF